MPRRLAGRRPAPARELERALERPGSALRPGDRAPNFVRVDQRGRPFALYERRCGRPSLLLVSPVLDDTAIGVLEALRAALPRSEEHTSELQSLMRTSYAVVCLKKTHQPVTPRTNRHSEA